MRGGNCAALPTWLSSTIPWNRAAKRFNFQLFDKIGDPPIHLFSDQNQMIDAVLFCRFTDTDACRKRRV